MTEDAVAPISSLSLDPNRSRSNSLGGSEKSQRGRSFRSKSMSPSKSTNNIEHNEDQKSYLSSFMPSSLFGSFGAKNEESTSADPGTSDGNAATESSMARRLSRSRTSMGSSNHPETLEGTLLYRKGRGVGALRPWKPSYVVFSMTDGGSICCYDKDAPTAASAQKLMFRREHNLLRAKSRFALVPTSGLESEEAKFRIPSHVDWIAKDIENSSSGFVIEIPSQDRAITESINISTTGLSNRPDEISPPRIGGDGDGPPSINGGDSTDTSPTHPISDDFTGSLQKSLERAREQGKPLRVYFKCSTSNEKLLWLRAFSQIDRFSEELRLKRGIRAALTSPNLQLSHRRVRSKHAELLAQQGRALDNDYMNTSFRDIYSYEGDGAKERNKMGGEKEYRVYPKYAYPNRWMTKSEMQKELLKPSTVYHDLRIPAAKQQEIGTLKVEVLKCSGLPALDYMSETDAVAYLVCGSYVFTTDVIWDRLNPIWLPKSRRACIFPVFHGYARLFVGVFDDDGKNEKDDFAGRVAIDLARCRPGSTYDVVLPLRLSTHVYSRRPRGAVRLRFTLNWRSDREALLSYIPKKIRSPTGPRPDDDVTVLCADEKAFRNIAITVHGMHLPGRFSFQQWRATMREVMFIRKVATLTLRELILDTITWKNPSLSFFVFFAYMHCIYANAFSLIPAYGASFLLVIMIRNYLIFGTDGLVQDGFIPPSWEELFYALVRPSCTKAIVPLEMKRARRPLLTELPAETSPEFPSRRIPSKSIAVASTVPITYKHKSKWFFRMLGFKEAEYSAPEEYQMEFPFSRGLHYPKFTVKESLVPKGATISLAMSKKSKKGNDMDHEEGGFEFGDDTPMNDKPAKTKLLSFDMDFLPKGRKGQADYDREEDNFLPQKIMAEKAINVAEKAINVTGLEQAVDQVQQCVGQVRHVLTPDTDKSAVVRVPVNPVDDTPPAPRIPEQDIDVKSSAKPKPLSDDLVELKENMHKLVRELSLFNHLLGACSRIR
jgi:hypothetical protein